jgi:cell division septation protein DedD
VTTNEGFREIQLNGKQLVFLFMAATVVSVVIFLCGVLVGRGVRPDRPAAPEATSAAIAPDPAVSAPAGQTATTPMLPPAEPPAPADELSYYDRLQKNNTPRENLKSPSVAPKASSSTPPRTVTPPPVVARQPSSADVHPAASSVGEPSGPGFAVQVMTFPDRQGADTLVKQLARKGYPAFAIGPVTSGGRTIYRVRVGKYKDKREAEAVSHRLETEEQFKPWIAR